MPDWMQPVTAPEAFFEAPIYGLAQADKSRMLVAGLEKLCAHHAAHCLPYARIVNALSGSDVDPVAELEDFPALAVRLFKHFDLKSVSNADVFKTLYSSGTSGMPSRIHLDRATAANQSRALVKIMQQWLGRQRLPMLIADHAGVMQDRHAFNARAAAIQGMLIFGRNPSYALREDLSVDDDALRQFVEQHASSPVLLFGFTSILWYHLLPALQRIEAQLPGAVLIHGGGWKKLADAAVDNTEFKRGWQSIGVQRVHNYYGMVEQTGSVFVECEHGHLHAPVFADVIIRDLETGGPLPTGQQGVIELLSVLPRSYPGHVLLTEDQGRILGEDDCPCGRKGRYFEVTGRIPLAELRGCSDARTTTATNEADDMRLLLGVPPQQVAEKMPFPPFAAEVVAFLSDLSSRLLTERNLRQHADLVALGYWLRPKALQAMQDDFSNGRPPHRISKAAGTVLHIAPANVDTLFAYSWALALLCGDGNIIRLSRKETEQRTLLLQTLAALFDDEQHEAVRKRTAIVSYGHDDRMTAELSMMCQRRIVWGGDATIHQLRAVPLPPLAQEVVFADRTSALLIDAAAVLEVAETEPLLGNLRRDIYGFNQQACSSPRTIIWLGPEDTVKQAKNRLWPAFRAMLRQQRPPLATADLMDKLVSIQATAAFHDVEVTRTNDHLLDLLDGSGLPAEWLNVGNGLLAQCRIDDIADLSAQLPENTQTLSYYGDLKNALAGWLDSAPDKLPDRIVPLGQALSFDTVWDGMDLMQQLSRTITVR